MLFIFHNHFLLAFPQAHSSRCAANRGQNPVHSLKELFGENTQARRSKRGPASKLEKQLKRISTRPKPRQRMVIDVIDVIEAMLAQHSSCLTQ